MVVTPVAIPDTIPDTEPTVPTEVLLLDHVPPVDALLSVVVKPIQALGLPVFGDSVDTDTAVVTKQPGPDI